jgi:Gp5 N-terminal OB domain
MKTESNFMGKEGFYWFVGVVEDRMDPLMLGRVRVRVLGAHTDDKTLIPTCKLHWAYVYQQPNNAAMNGIGHSNTGLVEGTWVFGFYKDAGAAQDPVVLAVIPGVPQNAPQPPIGFNDPSLPFHDYNTAPRKIKQRFYPNNGTGAQNVDESTASLYARATHPWGCIIGESDTNRLARAENVTDTIIGVRNRQRDVHVPIAFAHTTPGRMWNEPMSSYDAEYPYNHVFESESGHIFEVDDTPGAERLHFYHRSGTYVEINGGLTGDFQMKVVGKRFEVTMENSYSHYQNCMNVTVDGETNIYVRNNVNLQVDGDMNVHVGGNYNEKVVGNYTTDIGGNRLVRIGGNDELDVKGNQTMKVGGNVAHSAGGSYTIAAGGVITESAGGPFSMTSGAIIAEDAPTIQLNSGDSSSVSPQSPASPSLPPFPAPTSFVETRNETGPDPVVETKPDPSPTSFGQSDC